MTRESSQVDDARVVEHDAGDGTATSLTEAGPPPGAVDSGVAVDAAPLGVAEGGMAATMDGGGTFVDASLGPAVDAMLVDAGDASPPGIDAASAGTAADEFIRRLKQAIASAGGPATCASSIGPVARAAGRELDIIRGFIAEVRHIPASTLVLQRTECGTAGLQTCARAFQHHVYKSDGSYGEALYPLLDELETRTGNAQSGIWIATVDGITLPADLSFGGLVDGSFVGVVVFNDLHDCPR